MKRSAQSRLERAELVLERRRLDREQAAGKAFASWLKTVSDEDLEELAQVGRRMSEAIGDEAKYEPLHRRFREMLEDLEVKYPLSRNIQTHRIQTHQNSEVKNLTDEELETELDALKAKIKHLKQDESSNCATRAMEPPQAAESAGQPPRGIHPDLSEEET